nr:immunoglobulin heavy chain junction region [Macaca mulatta]MOW83238.1 immunoglobulin heavy chain junction region [Macaca mulatta]MOW83370.1 immunoglobulin heavy chain junction region [Macaca mulatta]MOW83617.1 immunoglobulin heavy chain junction region [Macaca mulatta]MOW85277.1 immunoglobulin heavy chain junction region [Macaca mulatta]
CAISLNTFWSGYNFDYW